MYISRFEGILGYFLLLCASLSLAKVIKTPSESWKHDDRSLEKLVQCLRNCQVASSAEPINLKRLLKFKIGSRNLVDSAQDDVLDLAKSVGTNALSQNNEESNSENNDKSSRESPTSAGTGSVVIEHTDDITIPNVNWYCHNNCWHVSSVAVG